MWVLGVPNKELYEIDRKGHRSVHLLKAKRGAPGKGEWFPVASRTRERGLASRVLGLGWSHYQKLTRAGANLNCPVKGPLGFQ